MDQPVTIQQPDRPQMTIEVPAGWRARETRRALILTRDGRRVVVRQCRLDRADRDLSGETGRNRVPVRGGGCLIVSRRAPKLRAQLGDGTKVPASNREAERLARAARTRTLNAARAMGTLRAVTPRQPLSATWAWDLPGGYFHSAGSYPSTRYEVVRDAAGDHARLGGATCWVRTAPATEDDVPEPRLELQELDAPPRRSTTWRLSYQAPRRLPDGSTFLRWNAFIHDGEAIVGADGLLRGVRIRDHGQADARAPWSALDIAFTAYPAEIARIAPQPRC